MSEFGPAKARRGGKSGGGNKARATQKKYKGKGGGGGGGGGRDRGGTNYEDQAGNTQAVFSEDFVMPANAVTSSSGGAVGDYMTNRLSNFYSKYDPAKVSEVSKLLAKCVTTPAFLLLLLPTHAPPLPSPPLPPTSSRRR